MTNLTRVSFIFGNCCSLDRLFFFSIFPTWFMYPCAEGKVESELFELIHTLMWGQRTRHIFTWNHFNIPALGQWIKPVTGVVKVGCLSEKFIPRTSQDCINFHRKCSFLLFGVYVFGPLLNNLDIFAPILLQSCVVGSSLIAWKRKFMLREVKWLAEGHTGRGRV